MASKSDRLSKSEWREISRLVSMVEPGCVHAKHTWEVAVPIVRFICASQRSEPNEHARQQAIAAGLSERMANALQLLVRAIAN